MGKRRGYSIKETDKNSAYAKISNMSCHFKTTLETVNVIKGMTVKRANAYLKNVLAKKECVPFKKHNGGVGRTAQAKAFKTTQGRWPRKSAKVVLALLQNAVSNAEYSGIDSEELYVQHIQANRAQIGHRRTYRAHGRITPFNRHQTHIQVILSEKEH